MKKFTQLAAISVLAGLSTISYAYEAGDIIVRVGVASVQPEDSSDGVAVPALGVPAAANTGASVDSDSQLGLTLTYMLSPSFGVELLAATPFTHDIAVNLDGIAAGVQAAAGETSHLPPTLSAVYYPLSAQKSAFQPYVGVGINHTIFFDEEANIELETVTGALAGAAGPVPLTLNLENSWGLALQLGADYALNENWHVNASVRWIDINTEATFTSVLGETITVDNVEIDPYVYQLNIGYTF